MLCTRCQDIFAGRCKVANAVKYDRFMHYVSAALIELSAENCYICSTIWTSFRTEDRNRLQKVRCRYGSGALQSLRQAAQSAVSTLTGSFDSYNWHCSFHDMRLVFEFGRPLRWACVKFDLLHPTGIYRLD